MPSKWSFTHFQECKTAELSAAHIGIIQIFFAVILEASLWGLGTAIGELPPYFVARAAAISGQKYKEFDEF